MNLLKGGGAYGRAAVMVADTVDARVRLSVTPFMAEFTTGLGAATWGVQVTTGSQRRRVDGLSTVSRLREILTSTLLPPLTRLTFTFLQCSSSFALVDLYREVRGGSRGRGGHRGTRTYAREDCDFLRVALAYARIARGQKKDQPEDWSIFPIPSVYEPAVHLIRLRQLADFVVVVVHPATLVFHRTKAAHVFVVISHGAEYITHGNPPRVSRGGSHPPRPVNLQGRTQLQLGVKLRGADARVDRVDLPSSERERPFGVLGVLTGSSVYGAENSEGLNFVRRQPAAERREALLAVVVDSHLTFPSPGTTLDFSGTFRASRRCPRPYDYNYTAELQFLTHEFTRFFMHTEKWC